MKTLFRNAKIVNVFIDAVENGDILVEDGRIAGVGSYASAQADRVIDLGGKYVCPGLIDGHIHIESSMLQPAEFARIAAAHGTTAVVMDPHEIANVSGVAGIRFMLEASRGLPVDMYCALPSCVPASPFDENGAELGAEELRGLYAEKRVVALGEVMNFPGVIGCDPAVTAKLRDALEAGRVINGHAPMLTGEGLDRYIAAGVSDDHETTSADEAKERVRKGQTVMIRQGSAARDLHALLPLFEEPWSRHCILATDDKHPAHLLARGHMDHIIREAVRGGASPLTAIRMATIQAARHFRLYDTGAIAPGYRADMVVVENLETMHACSVWKDGVCVAENGEALPFAAPEIDPALLESVMHSFRMEPVTEDTFRIEPFAGEARVICMAPHSLLTAEERFVPDLSVNNGIDAEHDILKLAVLERHRNTGHAGLGYVKGLGLRRGAIASSVSHDSHNLIVAGTNDADMAAAANAVREMGGGSVAVLDGKVLAALELPIGGLMSSKTAAETAEECERLHAVTRSELGANADIEPFMNTAFVSLPVIPSLKMTTRGLVDVNKWRFVPLAAGGDR